MNTYVIDRENLRTVYELDSATGAAVPIWHPIVHGVGSIKRLGSNKQIVAIFADSNKLYCQIGKNNWDISKLGLTFVNRRVPLFLGLLREFLVVDSSQKTLFQTVYFDRFIFSWKNWIDITYDEFDRQMDDIYLWLSREANDPNWKAELLARWTKGIPVPETKKDIKKSIAR